MKNINEQLISSLKSENIRKRPGMYIGCVDEAGVYELISGLAEDIISGCNGADISIKINLIRKNTLTFIFNSFLNNSFYLEIVKALSAFCEINSGNKYYICNKGSLISETSNADNQKNLFKIIFKPDYEIFSCKNLNYYMIFKRMKELAQLNENVKFHLADNDNKNIFQFHDGLSEMLNENLYKIGNRKPLNICFIKDDIEVSVSMVYGYAINVTLSYVDNLRTICGGTHVQGLYDGIFYAFKKYIKKYIDKNIKITKNDTINGLSFVIRVRMEEPEFTGATKWKLANNTITGDHHLK